MTILGSSSDALFHALSDFWLRWFKDSADLRALYEGAEYLLGQAYLNLLSDVLGSAVLDVPLFKKEYFRLLTIRSDEVTRGVYQCPDAVLGKLPCLQNKVFAAEGYLEDGVDYLVTGSTISFTTPLFNSDGSPALEGFAYRQLPSGLFQISLWAVDAELDQFDLYYRFGHFFSDKRASTEAYRAFVRGVMQLHLLGPTLERLESALNVVAGLPIVRQEGERLLSIDDGITASGLDGTISEGALTTASTFDASAIGGYVTLPGQGLTLQVVGFSATPAGTLLQLAPSTLLSDATGAAWQFGPTNSSYVTTDKNTYSLPRGVPLRTDLAARPLSAFEPLTAAVTVTDYVSDPEWWHQIVLPDNLLPSAAIETRSVSAAIATGVIGYSEATGFARIGDLGFSIGPAPGTHWSPALQAYVDDALGTPATPLPRHRRRHAFLLVDQVLKLHLFGVIVDSRVDLSGLLIADLAALIQEAKPTDSQVYLSTTKPLSDPLRLRDDQLSGLLLHQQLPEDAAAVETQWKVGARVIGETFLIAQAGALAPLQFSSGPPNAAGWVQRLLIGGPDPLASSPPHSFREDLKVQLRPA